MFKVHRSYELTTGVKNNSIAVLNQGPRTTVLYHKTPVFTCIDRATKLITIKDGGWDTVSTRAVINRALELSGTDWRLARVKGKTVLKCGIGLVQDFNGYAEIYT